MSCDTHAGFNEPRLFPLVLGLAWAGRPALLHASRRFTPPDPRESFVALLSAPRSPSIADGVGQDLASLVSVRSPGLRFPVCSESSRVGVGHAPRAFAAARLLLPPSITDPPPGL